MLQILFSPHSRLFYYWWEREIEERCVSYLFRERCEDTREEHHAPGNTANLRENILWELSVNTSIQFSFSENISQTVDAGRRSCLALQPPHPNLHSHAVLADSCAIAVHACVDTINLSAGVLTRICSGCLLVDIISLDISFISDCFMPYTYIFPPLASYWTLTRSSIGLFSAGTVWLLMQSFKEFANCNPPALCTEPCLMREYGSCC